MAVKWIRRNIFYRFKYSYVSFYRAFEPVEINVQTFITWICCE